MSEVCVHVFGSHIRAEGVVKEGEKEEGGTYLCWSAVYLPPSPAQMGGHKSPLNVGNASSCVLCMKFAGWHWGVR